MMKIIVYIFFCIFLSACPKKNTKSEFREKRYPVMNKDYIEKQKQQITLRADAPKQDGLSRRVLGITK
ncbi:hypothetical protein Cyrtocomes_00456 [Candidatus Cyrtobacter comes]|uniref:Lipoprotein n=1 Tax=Candidatus Cyrtobacter comes TaxID=675776 RepID=A0ABU5L7J2_9RICK|nr:hypothetical protein [Candidatus Cyrtobacter comes]MDZ5762088.1 hypothetical protein [Candidatus Cyrtobacter comes]